ncbi:recombinase family protein [Candidatus Chromulinivorax destructor]|uniref:Recombinase family protein n=1 Tax=Candidatus Chromulinivorax destructor TaxID=2066483 RepID=A0A345ZCY7_9BACT|nr:recombinase family protein [Candidatus Chromulinivorax destructor]AXK61154.1 recombinase family protein [Candidatus Chromulinivorax destructor]
MIKVIVYARVSSKEQEVEGYSIPAQLKCLQEYATKNGFIIVKEFTDVETAKKAGRTQFNKMLNFLAEDTSVKHILVEKTDRLLRNITDYALIDRLIEYCDVRIHLIKEGGMLSKDSRSNEKFIFGIKALMSKNYVDNLSEEVRKGMTEKAAQGIYPSLAPYGYINAKENGKSVIKVDPAAAIFVQQMFELYSTGSYSLLTLRRTMINDGMIYRNGKNFYTSTIETIFKNEFYTGVFFWKGKKYENASHEALISKEMFQRVQDVLINPNKSKSRKGLFPFTNLIRCGMCNSNFTAEIKKEKYIYYHCSGNDDCNKTYLKQETIDDLFSSLFDQIHISAEIQTIILQGLRESFKDKIEYHNALISELEQQIKRLQNRIDQTYLDKLDGKISEAFWQTKTKEWSTEQENLNDKLFAAKKADVHYLENADFIIELAQNAGQLFKTGNTAKKRRVIDMLTSNCVYKDGNIDVELKPVFGEVLKTVKTRNWCAR